LGEIKRTEINKFANIRNNGLIAFDIEEGDELNWALRTRGKDDVILISREGMSIRFPETAARGRGRQAGGVRAVKFKKPGDYLVSADVARDEATLLVVAENGYGKRTPIDEYRVQGRGGSGILTMNVTEKTGRIVGAEVVDADDRLLVMTMNGKGIRIKVKEIRTTGRVAQGVRLINLGAGDQVKTISRVVAGADDGETEDEGEEE
jgi:DNA gyrase subunit A